MTSKQIETEKRKIYAKLHSGIHLSSPEKERLSELMFRAMIISCICYAQERFIYDETKNAWGETGIEYGVNPFGEEKAMSIYKDQKEYMEKHAQIIENAGCDHEGCRYNSIIWN